MNNKPLLSICIPTHNGGDNLIENLAGIIPQLSIYSDDVELIISDNGSNEDNIRKLDSFIKSLQYEVRFIHHEENIGAQRNFFSVASMARGKYIYLLGDDDILSPSFLDCVLPYLRLEKYSLFYMNFMVGDINLKFRGIVSSEYREALQETNLHDLLCREDVDLTFMSSVIFKSECWYEGEQYIKDTYMGYEWFARMCFGVAVTNQNCAFYYFPIVLQRNQPRPWGKMKPVYFYISQRMIYRDLDKYVPGVFLVRKSIQHQSNMEYTYVEMLKNREFYHEYESLFQEILDEGEYKQLRYYLHTPFPFLAKIIFYIKYKIKQIAR